MQTSRQLAIGHVPVWPAKFWFALVSVLSAFLLFSLEPLIAKQILPSFGGTAAVWSTCLVFYQAALLLGTWFAQRLSVLRAKGRTKSMLYLAVLVLALCFLPIGPSSRWLSLRTEHPAGLILILLTATIATPFALLSASNTLLQTWYPRQWEQGTPLWMYAVSNGASLLGLLTYPLAIEPYFTIAQQRIGWSVLFALFVGASGTLAWFTFPDSSEAPGTSGSNPIPISKRIRWFIWSASGCMLLLATTNHLSANVAAVPLLWVLPLATYLLSFVLAFASSLRYNRSLYLRILLAALGLMAYAIYDINAVEPLQISLPIFLFGLFSGCMVCHCELAQSSPQNKANLPQFYLAIAGGGAFGGIFIGLLCPLLFDGTYDLALVLLLLSIAVGSLLWTTASPQMKLLVMCMSALMGLVLVANIEAFHAGSISLRRSFYGSLRVVQSPYAGPTQTRTLYHGTIQHGAEYLLPPGRTKATTYYGPDSGIGIVLRECVPSPKRVGIVGLGVGTIAAYGMSGDVYRFFEINEQDIEIASSLFFYLRESKAHVDVVQGDGRLALAGSQADQFDVLALDAFSGDAVPVHLLTREAFQIYQAHLKPGGVLAFHVSNDFLDLASVVNDLAKAAGWQAICVRSHMNEDAGELPADWVIVTQNADVLTNPSLRVHSVSFPNHTAVAWTDQFSSLWRVLKTPKVR